MPHNKLSVACWLITDVVEMKVKGGECGECGEGGDVWEGGEGDEGVPVPHVVYSEICDGTCLDNMCQKCGKCIKMFDQENNIWKWRKCNSECQKA